jgi:CheY-like chemotaxis protein
LNILLIEDNRGDVRLVRESLAGCASIELVVAMDGLEALKVLQDPGRRPDLILLDLNLPGMDGRALLGRIKSDPELRRIPLVVLTSSNAPRDVQQAYGLHANCYMVKPTDFSRFEASVRRLVEFWTEIAVLPGRA